MNKKIYLFVLLFTFINCFAIQYNWASDHTADELTRAESAKENIDRKGLPNWLCKMVRIVNALHLGASEKSALSDDEANQFMKVLQLTLTKLYEYIYQPIQVGEGDQDKIKEKKE